MFMQNVSVVLAIRRKAVRVIDIPQIEKLGVAEKILLVEDLWNSISAEESAIPAPQSHIQELERRFARHKS